MTFEEAMNQVNIDKFRNEKEVTLVIHFYKGRDAFDRESCGKATMDFKRFCRDIEGSIESARHAWEISDTAVYGECYDKVTYIELYTKDGRKSTEPQVLIS
jgi:hypothetical protein